ncbi:MAG: hypothetical protein HXY41_09555 [Chloroflexi bacterium]|nr:hypothetical protein [Chloroflexota bacterium]
MSLTRRLMWPKTGEEVQIFENGSLVVEGHVTYSGDDEVRILTREAETTILDANQLLTGIDNRSVMVKKKARRA